MEWKYFKIQIKLYSFNSYFNSFQTLMESLGKVINNFFITNLTFRAQWMLLYCNEFFPISSTPWSLFQDVRFVLFQELNCRVCYAATFMSASVENADQSNAPTRYRNLFRNLDRVKQLTVPVSVSGESHFV